MKKLSVVIATFNRKDTLRLVLTKLGEQTYSTADYEVVVVDDESNDGTPAAIQALIPTLPYTLKYIRHTNRGVGATENRGIKEAEGEIVLIMPDDIVAKPILLETHMKFHAENPELNKAMLARIEPSPDLPKTAFLTFWQKHGFPYDHIPGGSEVGYLYFWTSNISLKRCFMMENGLFREALGVAHEDVELGYRLCQKGLRIFYNAAVGVGYHHHAETLRKICYRAYMKGINWSVLADNVPDPGIYEWFEVFSPKLRFPALLRLGFKQMVRLLCFNRFTVPTVLYPILEKAETNRVIAAIAPIFYWKAINYYFRKGISDAKKQTADQRRLSIKDSIAKEYNMKF